MQEKTIIDLQKIKKVFFVGIGGIGISAIARMMLLKGKEVTGSDISESGITSELKKLGADIKLGQGIELVPKDTNLIVFSIAIKKKIRDFFKKFKTWGFKFLVYPKFLG